MNNQNDFRSINNVIVEYYEIPLKFFKQLGKKSYFISDEKNNNYFLKKAPYNTLEKYQFLASQGIDNVLYPNLNKQKEYISRGKNYAFYITDYINSTSVLNEVRAQNMLREVTDLHKNTTIKRQLSVRTSRPKFEEITKELDLKFRMIENYIRGIEVRPLDVFSMPILGNYQFVLNAKNELIRLQKRIITSIKGKEKVDYSYIHNRPSIDHLLNYRGVNYLTSLENGKIGIPSLDIAKFYIENEDLNLDFHEIIVNDYFGGENSFYYDYFRFTILFVFIKRLVISSESYTTAQSFVNFSKSFEKYYNLFLDNKENISEDNKSNNN